MKETQLRQVVSSVLQDLFELKRVASPCQHWPTPEKLCTAIQWFIFESVALSLSESRFAIEPTGSGHIVSDDSDLVCLHEGYVDGLHLA